MLVTEYVERGDLFNAISDGPANHSENIVSWYQKGRSIALDVAQGLHSLHIRQVIHFDLKSPNVLLTNEYIAKIADVGLAHTLASRTHLSQMSQMR